MTARDLPAASGRGLLTAVSWLDWKLGARLLLKYPALTIIGDIVGILGGAVVAVTSLDLSVHGYLIETQRSVASYFSTQHA